MKTRLLLLWALAAAAAATAAEFRVTGDKAQLRQVLLSTAVESRTVRVTLPAAHDGLVIESAGLQRLDYGLDPDGRRLITAVFAADFSVRSDAAGIVVSAAAPAAAARDASGAVREEARRATAAATSGTAAPATSTAPAAPAQEKKEAEREPEPTLALGSVAFRLPGQAAFKDRSASYDAAIPESPAAAVIGSSATLVRFTDAKDAGVQLLNLTDADGKLNTGFSFAFHPYRLLARPTLDRYVYGAGTTRTSDQDYDGGKWIRFLSRLDLSLAATVDSEAGPGGERGATAALGLSGFVFNRADSRLHLARAIVADAALDSRDDLAPEAPVGEGGVQSAVVQPSERLARIAQQAYAGIWNDSYWAFGLAPRFRSDTGRVGDFHYDGGAAWTTLGYGFEDAGRNLGLAWLEDNAQLLLHASFRDRQRIADAGAPGGWRREDAFIYGVQFRAGRADLNAFAEFLWQRHRPELGPRRSSETYSVGFEKRLKEDLWLQLTLGSEETPTTTGRSTLLRTALSYGFGDVLGGEPPKKD